MRRFWRLQGASPFAQPGTQKDRKRRVSATGKRVLVKGPHSPDETNQAEVIRFLADPLTYGDVGQVERFETHGNLIFLAGPDAWKIKRAVRFPYMDFSSLASRKAACAREVERNRRTAPEIYLGCVPITRRGDGSLALGGSGDIVEWAVHMHRFEQSALLSNIAAAGGIGAALAKLVADVVYESHQTADRQRSHSGTAPMRELVASVAKSLADAKIFREAAAHFSSLAEDQICRAAAILDERARHGAVRSCHGDLHLGNIVLWRERPVLYDAIEFDDTIATIDVLYDLAFLLMDLDWHGQHPAANLVLNHYLWRAQDELDLSGLRAMPLFLGLRAGIRAMVTADRAGQETDAAGEHDRERARTYLRAARRYLASCPHQLVAIGGVSGTGKSTLAAALAPRSGPAPGAVHLRSDLERKALFGVEETDRLPSETYTREASDRVYAILGRKARLVLAAGHSVIADAVCLTPTERSEMERIAREMGVPFQGIWLVGDRETLRARLNLRSNDASDATQEILAQQLARDMGSLSPAWTQVEAGASADEMLHRVMSAMRVDGSEASGSPRSGDGP
jgi:uncharacterized protein